MFAMVNPLTGHTLRLNGVPQGLVLPFLVHINDLPEDVTTNAKLFADDTSLLFKILQHFQHLLKFLDGLTNRKLYLT